MTILTYYDNSIVSDFNKDGWYIKYLVDVPDIKHLPSICKMLQYKYFLIKICNKLCLYYPESNTYKELDNPIKYLEESNARYCKRNIFITTNLENHLRLLIEQSLEHYKLLCKTTNELYRILFKRDMLQMIYNMIQYYLHCNNFTEALLLINEYYNCFPKDISTSDNNNDNCGCAAV